MRRSTTILIIDAFAFAGFLFLTSTGILLHYLLPPGSGRWSSIWDLNRHEWGEIHFWIAVVFFSVLSLHLVLHWRVIANLLKGRQSKEPKFRLALGIIGLITIVLFAVAPLVSPPSIEADGRGHQFRGMHK